MRASSFTAPVFLSSGTLKSTRMKSLFPEISSCSIDLIMPSRFTPPFAPLGGKGGLGGKWGWGAPRSGAGTRSFLKFSRDEEAHIHHPVREAPLVVVPGEDLDELAVVGHRGLRRVEDRRRRVAVVVDADGQLGVVLQDAL